MEKVKEIERSIIKKFRKEIWSKFVKAVNDYELIKQNDKIAVCISGGKDSFLLAKCMQEIRRHGKVDFDLEYIVMNPGYNLENLELIKRNANVLDIPIHIFDTNVFEVSTKLNKENPCYMCARMRRGYLYDYAKQLGCNKIALGHHYDDVIETILLNIFYGGEFKTMMPKLHSTNFDGLELIRPLYLVREEAIHNWMKYNNLTFLNCACSFTSKRDEDNSKRKKMKELIKELSNDNMYVPYNIFKSAFNVNLRTVISYYEENLEKSFLDDYDK